MAEDPATHISSGEKGLKAFREVGFGVGDSGEIGGGWVLWAVKQDFFITSTLEGNRAPTIHLHLLSQVPHVCSWYLLSAASRWPVTGGNNDGGPTWTHLSTVK